MSYINLIINYLMVARGTQYSRNFVGTFSCISKWHAFTSSLR